MTADLIEGKWLFDNISAIIFLHSHSFSLASAVKERRRKRNIGILRMYLGKRDRKILARRTTRLKIDTIIGGRSNAVSLPYLREIHLTSTRYPIARTARWSHEVCLWYSPVSEADLCNRPRRGNGLRVEEQSKENRSRDARPNFSVERYLSPQRAHASLSPGSSALAGAKDFIRERARWFTIRRKTWSRTPYGSS